MITALLAMFVIPVTAWLVNKAGWLWFYGDAAKFCSQPANHARRVAEWQARIDERQQQLDYYHANPNWFDLEWPVCNTLVVSEDGEYCSNCFRQVHEHLVRVGVV